MDVPSQIASRSCTNVPITENACAELAKAFWACIDDGQPGEFREEDVTLFRMIFNPSLSDRRSEGEGFVLPDCSQKHISTLQALVKEEENFRQKRSDHFFSLDFSERIPGTLFPSSWASHIDVTNAESCIVHKILQLPSDHTLQPDLLKSKTPTFQKKTEDGTTFSIYRLANVEIRTSQTLDGTTVRVVYSLRNAGSAPSETAAAGYERVVKVTEYVDNTQAVVNIDGKGVYKYFAVVETEKGFKIVTERTTDTVTWVENELGLEERTSLAKVIRSADCSASGTIVQDLERHRANALQQRNVDDGRTYATGVYIISLGGMHGVAREVERRQKEWANFKH